jgi:hypothetical protein
LPKNIPAPLKHSGGPGPPSHPLPLPTPGTNLYIKARYYTKILLFMQKDAEKKENPPSSLQKKGCGGILNAMINRNLGGVGYFAFLVAFQSTGF